MPPDQECVVSAAYQRLRMFLGAIAQMSDDIDLLGIVPAQVVEAARGRQFVAAVREAYGIDGVRVHLVPVHLRQETAWNHYAAGMGSIFFQPGFHYYSGWEQVAGVAERLDEKPDLVFVHRLSMMCPVLRSGRRPARLFFDLDDIEHRICVRTAMQAPLRPGKIAYLAHAAPIWWAERRAAALADATFVCSERDRAHLRRLGISSHVTVVSNAVEMPPDAEPPVRDETLLFLGTYRYRPNCDAAERLVRRIWPIVRASAPEARLLIAGDATERLPGSRTPPPGVEYVGFVADLAALYARSRVVCCPLTVGGGTRLKLIEAAAHGKAMVATHVGAEGLAFTDGREILLADADHALASACVRLLHDDALSARLGAAARRAAAESYERSAIEERILAIMANATGRSVPGRGVPAMTPI